MKANGSRREERREEKISRKKSGASPGRREKQSVGRRGRWAGVGVVGRCGGRALGGRRVREPAPGTDARRRPHSQRLRRSSLVARVRPPPVRPLSRRRRPAPRDISRVPPLDVTCPKCSTQCFPSTPRQCSRSLFSRRNRPAQRSGLVPTSVLYSDRFQCSIVKSLFREQSLVKLKSARRVGCTLPQPQVVPIGWAAPSCRSLLSTLTKNNKQINRPVIFIQTLIIQIFSRLFGLAQTDPNSLATTTIFCFYT